MPSTDSHVCVYQDIMVFAVHPVSLLIFSLPQIFVCQESQQNIFFEGNSSKRRSTLQERVYSRTIVIWRSFLSFILFHTKNNLRRSTFRLNCYAFIFFRILNIFFVGKILISINQNMTTAWLEKVPIHKALPHMCGTYEW